MKWVSALFQGKPVHLPLSTFRTCMQVPGWSEEGAALFGEGPPPPRLAELLLSGGSVDAALRAGTPKVRFSCCSSCPILHLTAPICLVHASLCHIAILLADGR